MLIASQSSFEVEFLKLELKERFDMKDRGAVRSILGMDIPRERMFSNYGYQKQTTEEKSCRGTK